MYFICTTSLLLDQICKFSVFVVSTNRRLNSQGLWWRQFVGDTGVPPRDCPPCLVWWGVVNVIYARWYRSIRFFQTTVFIQISLSSMGPSGVHPNLSNLCRCWLKVDKILTQGAVLTSGCPWNSAAPDLLLILVLALSSGAGWDDDDSLLTSSSSPPSSSSSPLGQSRPTAGKA